ncbi:hypothetical protein [Phenylobacterium montanum]|uniref:Uncharacterized protein n=1 Tax=Phenylobacterium montanum TaxID=2823693 RepID=A0A975IV38_9CAUL|nr:hypothetical protein [Caulobacter sp. S6]QUD88169.1 hypothetical protein KCG34_24605 [Caulobacter sp. S6]
MIYATAFFATSSAAQSPSVTWNRVTDQHETSIEVPVSVLTPRADPDGLAFDAEKGAVRIRLLTLTEHRPGFPGNDPKGDMNLKRSDCTAWPPSYYALKDRLAAYSCIRNSKVTYYLARYAPSGSARLYVEYPVAESRFWDAVVKRMTASLQQVGRQEVR